MGYARKNLVSLQDTPYYHCVARCVRRAWLWGQDEYAGKNYSHRKQWVIDRLKSLCSVFSIEVPEVGHPFLDVWSGRVIALPYGGCPTHRPYVGCPTRRVGQPRSRRLLTQSSAFRSPSGTLRVGAEAKQVQGHIALIELNELVPEVEGYLDSSAGHGGGV